MDFPCWLVGLRGHVPKGLGQVMRSLVHFGETLNPTLQMTSMRMFLGCVYCRLRDCCLSIMNLWTSDLDVSMHGKAVRSRGTRWKYLALVFFFCKTILCLAGGERIKRGRRKGCRWGETGKRSNWSQAKGAPTNWVRQSERGKHSFFYPLYWIKYRTQLFGKDKVLAWGTGLNLSVYSCKSICEMNGQYQSSCLHSSYKTEYSKCARQCLNELTAIMHMMFTAKFQCFHSEFWE